MSGAARLALVLLAALLIAACGSDEDAETTEQPAEPATTAATTAEPTTGGAAGTELAITVWELGRDGGEPAEYTLTCDPAGGDLPDPEAACAALAAGSVEFDPVPADAICTEIYGGPAEATVTGTVAGEPVDASFSRQNGCEISRWESAMPLLPADLNAWMEQELPASSMGS